MAMALRDTLAEMAREAEAPLDLSALHDEWFDAIEKLFNRIRDYLDEYFQDKSLSIASEGRLVIEEEDLGEYAVPVMSIKAGPMQIEVRPVGRLIVGATGRVDLYRQGRAALNERVMILRQGSPQKGVEDKWVLRLPNKDDPSFRIRNLNALSTTLARQQIPFDKPGLEEAIDRLLR
jgi:hypothetical protein